ncbi:ABC transporter permease [candidate division KSB1 bacterium]
MKILSKLSDRISRFVLDSEKHYGYYGDIKEIYFDMAKETGKYSALYWYWKQVIKILPSFIVTKIFRSTSMFKIYIKITIRNIGKHRGISIINILGLSLGMAVCILLTMWVFDEFNYNKFHENHDRLYRVTELSYSGNSQEVLTGTVAPLGPVLKKDFPEIADYTRYQPQGSVLISYEGKKFYENSVIAANNSLFKLFSFPFVIGDINNVLLSPNSVVINENTAKKYFGDSDPIGKIIRVNNKYDFIVEGVFRNIGSNSDIQFNIVLAWDYLESIYPRIQWNNHVYTNYVLLAENADEEETERKIKNVINDHYPSSRFDVFLQPLSDVHLRSNFGGGFSNETYVYFVLIIAVFVLLLACINFMNISTACALYRYKEIGMRKVCGGRRKDIIFQFLNESLLFSFISFIIAILIVLLVLPVFNNFTEKQLILNLINDWMYFGGLLVITFFIGIITGSYPALYFSSFKPLNILKGIQLSGVKNKNFSRILVMFQFAGSIILISGTFTVFSQLDYMMNADLGWDREQLLYINMRGDTNKTYDLMKSELSKNPGIISISGGLRKPSYGAYGTGYKINWTGKDPDYKPSIAYNSVDFNYIETVGLKLVKGRSFSKDFPSDTLRAYVINESLAELIGADQIIGADFTVWDVPGKIIGVVKDFHYYSLRSEIGPMVLRCQYRSWLRYIILKISPENISSTTEFINDTWEKFNPDYPLVYGFVNDDFSIMYREYKKMGKMVEYASIIAVFIACLGLIGLVSFRIEKKKKEIGIRKAIGASTASISQYLTREFIRLISTACAIAIPIAYYTFGLWLDNFPYRTEPGIGLFVISGLSAMLIALFSVSFQVIKAARANPVDSLRYE